MAQSAFNACVDWVTGSFMCADCLTNRLGSSNFLWELLAAAKYGLTQKAIKPLMRVLPEGPPDGVEPRTKLNASSRGMLASGV